MFIKPPDGKEWEVYWTKLEGGEVWLDKGWKAFAENYSLDHGYLVLFKYEGTSLFRVLILDQSALEIDYPSRDTCDGNESVEISGERPGQKARHKSPLFSPRSHRIRKTRGMGFIFCFLFQLTLLVGAVFYLIFHSTLGGGL